MKPFWKAVFGYDDAPGAAGHHRPAPARPGVWFQQMDAPRPQRNRIHFDVWVAADEADGPHRGRASPPAAGCVDDAAAPTFRVVADPEGNEACVCVYVGRG